MRNLVTVNDDDLREMRDRFVVYRSGAAHQTNEADRHMIESILPMMIALLNEVLSLRGWNRQMVEMAASGGRLDGYRELADKLAAKDGEIERMTEENRRLRADLLAGRNVVNAGLTIHTLTIERDMLRQEIERLTAERDDLRDVLLRSGFVPCDVPACNCGSWHHRYGLPERMRDIEDTLSEAGHELSNANGHLPINALKALVAERDELRRQLAEAELDAQRYRWLRPRFFAADFAYSDPPVCAIVFRWPESAKISANLDREIDAAMGLTRPAEES